MPPGPPFPWKVGEHIAVVGDTGSGKTFLVRELTDLRAYCVVFRTKGDNIVFRNMHKTTRASTMDDLYKPRLLLHPKYEHQLREGYDLLERAYTQGGWTVVIDEQWYVEKLGLRAMVERLLTQARSLHVSVVMGMQRPSQISRFILSQASHVFVFRTEGRDVKTVAEATSPRMREAVDSLTGYDFAYFHRPTRTVIARGNAKRLASVLVGVKAPTGELARTGA